MLADGSLQRRAAVVCRRPRRGRRNSGAAHGHRGSGGAASQWKWACQREWACPLQRKWSFQWEWSWEWKWPYAVNCQWPLEFAFGAADADGPAADARADAQADDCLAEAETHAGFVRDRAGQSAGV